MAYSAGKTKQNPAKKTKKACFFPAYGYNCYISFKPCGILKPVPGKNRGLPVFLLYARYEMGTYIRETR
jgi:hypothetical protein